MEPFYDKKDGAKLAAQEAALAAPKLPVKPSPGTTSAMEVTPTNAPVTAPNNLGTFSLTLEKNIYIYPFSSCSSI